MNVPGKRLRQSVGLACARWLILIGLLSATSIGAAQNGLQQQLDNALSTAKHAPGLLFVRDSRSPQQLLAVFTQLATEIRDVFAHGSREGDIDSAQEQQLIDLYTQMAQLIDGSILPESERFARTNALLSQLSEVIARIPLPPNDQIPDQTEVAQQKLNYWRVPGSTIALQRIQDGPRVGDWIISDDTVRNTEALYQAALSQFPPAAGETPLLDHYLAYSGPLISTQITDAMPGFLRQALFGQPLWKYLATAVIVLISLFSALLVYRFSRIFTDRWDDPNEITFSLVRLILPLLLLLFIPLWIQVIAIDVRLRLLPLDLIDDVLWVWFYATATWALLVGANLVAAVMIRSPSISPAGLDASMVRLTCRLIAYALAIWVWVEGLQALGVSLIPLLAGLGVSGLAFALAAKPTLGNLLGGVILFADKPFRVGDRVVIGDHQGMIEEIGLRSTRLRTLDGHLVSLPNDEVCISSIENVAARPNIKRLLNVTLTYDTPPEKIERAIEIIQQLLSLEEDGDRSEDALGRPSNQRIHEDDENLPPRVYFSDLNADSLNILVLYWFSPPDYWAYLEHATWFNLQLIERFNAAGIEFAFPTQTIDLKPRDPAALTAPT
ncbi:mechanosensitive ion channel family protein [Halochromatium roseum]|uniref:mechanosensitive ion channel family protein n=1 Tax=Halochromatium roseum TaxID=391920 RepID=UPI0019135A21|nr:mechanosensitive ion channel family protein [Halochromatium roseum]MBK5938004.1 hypothetical protein [Halochromatium roseum]